MTVSRREFIQWSAAATALAATGLDLSAAPAKVAPKKILILGGTGFLPDPDGPAEGAGPGTPVPRSHRAHQSRGRLSLIHI